jgi:hypothetical protein
VKKLISGFGLSALISFVSFADTITSEVPTTPAATNVASAAGLETDDTSPAEYGKWKTVEISSDSKLLQKVSAITNSLGQVAIRTNFFKKLEGGMHYRGTNGDYLPAKAELKIQPDGSAAGLETALKVGFAPNISSQGPVTLQTDSQTLKGQIIGIAFFDYQQGKSVLVASIKSSVGVLTKNNEILYRDAFEGCLADVKYVYTKNGCAQWVILRERLPLPESFGLDGRSTWIEVWSEFLAPTPQPTITQETRKGWKQSKVDRLIDFGNGFQIGPGTAFSLGQAEDFGHIEVKKHWVVTDQRSFLVEEIPHRLCISQLRNLPEPQAAIARPQKNALVGRVSEERLWPESRVAMVNTNDRIQVAQIDTEEKGLVLDFELSGSLDSFTFDASTEYEIIGPLYLTGEIRIEGGSIIRFTNDANARIYVNGTVKCLSDAFHPAVFTSDSDWTVGSAWSTNELSTETRNARVCLYLANGGDLKYLNFRYAAVGVESYAPYTVDHCQFIHCDTALLSDQTSFSAHNILLYDVGTAFHGYAYSGHIEHLTFDVGDLVTASYLYTPGTCTSPPPSSVEFVNSLITDVSDWGVVPVATDHTVFTNSDGIYQTVGASSLYLSDESVYRSAGTNAISGKLAAELRKKTTWPPVLITDDFTEDTILNRRMIRDTDTNSPDLGFHFECLDYAMANRTISNGVTLTVGSGVSVGFYGDSYSFGSLLLDCDAALVSEGNPLSLSHLVWYNTVQSQDTTNWALPDSLDTIGFLDAYCSNTTVRCRFTDFSRLAGNGAHIGRGDIGVNGSISLRDSQFRSSGVSLQAGANTNSTLTVGITNCLFEKAGLSFFGQLSPLNADLYNNLFFQNAILFDDTDTNAGPVALTFRDNFFYTNVISTSAVVTVTHDHNAYLTNSERLGTLATGDVILTNFTFLTGSLGNYYQSSNSVLVDAGSRNSTNAGLFHYTTITNRTGGGSEIRETNSTVDLSIHYVALDSNGRPFDSNSNYVGDYFEDWNGNGEVNTNIGEPEWKTVAAGPGVPGGGTGGTNDPPILSRDYNPTNDLWLEITRKTNTTGFFVIHSPVTNVMYDLLETTNLATNVSGLNLTNWLWLLRTAAGQTNLTVTNLTTIQGYFMLGKTNDTDSDGLSDAVEKLVTHTLITTNNTDGDDLSDYEEYLIGRNPLAAGANPDTNNVVRLRIHTRLK